MELIRWGNDPWFVQREGIQLPAILTIWVSFGKKLLYKRVGESNIEEWSKCGGKKKWLICRI